MTSANKGKKRSFSNRVGTLGENGFRTFCERQFLLPAKMEEDVGIDFVCQVDPAKSIREISTIGGAFFGACVRASTKPSGRILLNRADAQNLLTVAVPVMVVLVKLEEASGNREVYFRMVDELFSLELVAFLESSRGTLSLTTTNCLPEKDFQSELKKAQSPGFVERVRLGLARKRVARLLPHAELTVVRHAEGDFSVVRTPRLFDLFERSDEPSQDALYVAAFGHQEKLETRLSRLHVRPGIVRSLEHLPETVLMQGFAGRTPVELEVVGQKGAAKCWFERTATGEHTGWVHKAGVSLTASRRTEKENQWVHLLEAFVDPEARIDLSKEPELFAFLECCTPGARVIVGPNHEYKAEQFRGLPELAWLAGYMRDAQLNSSWKASNVTLDRALDLETLNTMAVAAAMGREPNLLRGFGFLLADVPTTAEHVRRFRVPIIGNIGDKALVIWLEVQGTVFLSDGAIFGLRFDEVLGAAFEYRDRVQKTSNEPALVVHQDWPTLLIGDGPPRGGERPGAGWAVELAFSDDDDQADFDDQADSGDDDDGDELGAEHEDEAP